ncbi:hypothetical protein F8M41_003851 [Gigaspora margarita]|uniref:Uncharacterized protein n=1 Tax=Gigaspora margarita TaxID=4874 RepID=A0A8H3XC12_GIGMA|nr:hypothetical protein F8M41_003851 [Gigaspora margarita]
MDKYEDERKEVEKDLPNDRIGVVKIGIADEMSMVGPCCEKRIEVEKDEIMEARREEESGVKKDEKDDKPNENDNEEYDDDKTIVDENEGEKEKDVTKPTKKKDLDDACESWIKKVEVFRKMNNLSKETKEPTEKNMPKLKKHRMKSK